MTGRAKVQTLKSIELHRGDLPAGLDLGASIAVDTETMGLDPNRDRLCLVQLSGGDGVCHIVQFSQDSYEAPNLAKLITDPKRTKIFHFARFDIAMMKRHMGVMCQPVFCTKVASRLTRTYTDRQYRAFLSVILPQPTALHLRLKESLAALSSSVQLGCVFGPPKYHVF